VEDALAELHAAVRKRVLVHEGLRVHGLVPTVASAESGEFGLGLDRLGKAAQFSVTVQQVLERVFELGHFGSERSALVEHFVLHRLVLLFEFGSRIQIRRVLTARVSPGTALRAVFFFECGFEHSRVLLSG